MSDTRLFQYLVGYRRRDNEKYKINEARIGNGVFDAGREEDEIVLAYNVILAGNFHEPFTLQYMVDLFLDQMFVARDISHGLIHRDAIVDMPRACGLRHHQGLGQCPSV